MKLKKLLNFFLNSTKNMQLINGAKSSLNRLSKNLILLFYLIFPLNIMNLEKQH